MGPDYPRRHCFSWRKCMCSKPSYGMKRYILLKVSIFSPGPVRSAVYARSVLATSAYLSAKIYELIFYWSLLRASYS